MTDEQVILDEFQDEEEEHGFGKLLADTIGFFGIVIYLALCEKGEKRVQKADES